MLIFKVTKCYNYSTRMEYDTKQSILCSMMSEQPVQLSFVNWTPKQDATALRTPNTKAHWSE